MLVPEDLGEWAAAVPVSGCPLERGLARSQLCLNQSHERTKLSFLPLLQASVSSWEMCFHSALAISEGLSVPLPGCVPPVLDLGGGAQGRATSGDQGSCRGSGAESCRGPLRQRMANTAWYYLSMELKKNQACRNGEAESGCQGLGVGQTGRGWKKAHTFSYKRNEA